MGLHEDEEHALELVEEIVDESICPVIVQTDGDDPEFAARAAERGVFAFSTPVEADALQAAIEVAVRRFEELEELAEQVENLEGALRRARDRRARKGHADGAARHRRAAGVRAAARTRALQQPRRSSTSHRQSSTGSPDAAAALRDENALAKEDRLVAVAARRRTARVAGAVRPGVLHLTWPSCQIDRRPSTTVPGTIESAVVVMSQVEPTVVSPVATQPTGNWYLKLWVVPGSGVSAELVKSVIWRRPAPAPARRSQSTRVVPDVGQGRDEASRPPRRPRWTSFRRS